MMKSLWRRARQLSRRLWVRVMLIALLAFVAIGLAKLFGFLIPLGLADVAGAQALDRLLSIISNSMLIATTFSLTVMVTVHRAVSQQWTPRAHQVLMADTTTQTVLATFVGAYIYALTAIILLSTPLFGEREVFALYLMTIIVMALIVFMLLRWILHLQSLGSLMETARRIESETQAEMEESLRAPSLGAMVWLGDRPPQGAVPVKAPDTAYVKEIFVERLQEAAESCDARLYLEAPVGRFVHRGEVLAWMQPGNDALAKAVVGAFHTGAMRSQTQDPRFGLIQLSEIASKALSPGINDTGTAIDVLGRLTRLLMTLPASEDGAVLDRLFVRRLSPDDMLEDAFATIARDAAASVEVHIALQKHLGALAHLAEPGIAAAARRFGPVACARGMEQISFAHDRDRLRRAALPQFRPDGPA